jgi:hypothetical protein
VSHSILLTMFSRLSTGTNDRSSSSFSFLRQVKREVQGKKGQRALRALPAVRRHVLYCTAHVGIGASVGESVVYRVCTTHLDKLPWFVGLKFGCLTQQRHVANDVRNVWGSGAYLLARTSVPLRGPTLKSWCQKNRTCQNTRTVTRLIAYFLTR